MSLTPSARAALRAADKRFSAALPFEQRRRWFYLKAQKRLPRFRAPLTFSEKVNWRMLNDRREMLSWTCDKLKMKEHARQSGADVVVPRTLWSGRDVRDLRGVDLPERWVLKPTHRYGLVHFGGPDTDLETLAEQTKGWLVDEQSEFLGEWAYAQAEAQFLAEEFVGRPGSTPPDDYKIFVFHGEPRLVQVDLDRFSGHRRSLFTPEWEKIDATYLAPDAGPLPRPPLLEQMLEAARVLAADLDFIRIDLYCDEGQVVFGEYTPYPGGGLIPFRPRRLDVELGALWHLPPLDQADGRARG